MRLFTSICGLESPAGCPKSGDIGYVKNVAELTRVQASAKNTFQPNSPFNRVYDEIQLSNHTRDLHAANALLGLPRGKRNHVIVGVFARRPAKRRASDRPRKRNRSRSRSRQPELGKTELHGRDANRGPKDAIQRDHHIWRYRLPLSVP